VTLKGNRSLTKDQLPEIIILLCLFPPVCTFGTTGSKLLSASSNPPQTSRFGTAELIH